MVARLWLPAAFAIVSPIVCPLPAGFQGTLTPESARLADQHIPADPAKPQPFSVPYPLHLRHPRIIPANCRALGSWHSPWPV